MTEIHSKPETQLAVCRFCGKLPGTKVGPPALARCITPGCEGLKLAAVTIADWIADNAIPAQGQPKPVGWFNPWNDHHGYQQVAKEHEGSEGTIPLYAGPLPPQDAPAQRHKFEVTSAMEDAFDAALPRDENARHPNDRDNPDYRSLRKGNNFEKAFLAALAVAPLSPQDSKPVAWRLRHGGGRWTYQDEVPAGPSVHLFEVEALYNDAHHSQEENERAK